MYEEYFRKQLEKINETYDEEAGMPVQNQKPWTNGGGGYHTRLGGRVHATQTPALYAELVFFLREERYYERAYRCLWNLVRLQDRREGSRTNGLWSYYAEEPVDQMIAPDFNKTDFICRHFFYIMKERADCLPENLRQALAESMKLGAGCSIRRNVSADYTNISLMSLCTILGAAEVNGDAEMLAYGRQRLGKVLAYDAYCGNFSEYNSPTYTPLAMEELARMRQLVSDPECREMIEKLDDIAWQMFAKHYSAQNEQLIPPHIRAYHDKTDESVEMLLYVATNGRYGRFVESAVTMTRLPYRCPEKYYPYLEPIRRERWVDECYFRKNRLRDPAEDLTIIRNLDSPDLRAMSYVTPSYSFGAFGVCDTWVQRHNCMVIFGEKENLAFLRLRCVKGDETQGAGYAYDTCCGFVTADMKKNVLLGQLGFTTDHGDFHYILDKTKNGEYSCDSLACLFEFTGNTDGLRTEKLQNGYRFTLHGTTVEICVYHALFDGASAPLVWNEEKRALQVLFVREHRTLRFASLGPSVVTFTMAVDATCGDPVLTEKDGVRHASLGSLRVSSCILPVPYNDAVAQSSAEYAGDGRCAGTYSD